MLDRPVDERLGGVAPQELPIAGVAGSSPTVGLSTWELLLRSARGPVGLAAVRALRELAVSAGGSHGGPFDG